MSQLPADILRQVAQGLALEDVVQFHQVCHHWKQALETSHVYQKIAEQEWCPILCNNKLSPYRRSWRRLLLCKVATDGSFAQLMDQGASALMELQAYARERGANKGGLCPVNPRSPEAERMLMQSFMKATFQLGLQVQLKRWGKSKAFLAYLEATAALLKEPFVVACLNDFVAVSEQLCMLYDVWNGGFVEWSSVPWRRSALEFFTDFYIRNVYHPQPFLSAEDIPDPLVNPSKRSKRQASPKFFKQGIITSLDVTISSTAGEEAMWGDLSLIPLPGVPHSHWWWFPEKTMRRGYD